MIWTYITISVSDIKKASFVHVHHSINTATLDVTDIYHIWFDALLATFIRRYPCLKKICVYSNIYNRLYAAVCLTYWEGNEFFFYVFIYQLKWCLSQLSQISKVSIYIRYQGIDQV